MYDVNTLDLTGPAMTPTVLVERGKTVTEIAMLAIPDGVSFQIRFGQSGAWLTIPAPFTMKPTGDTRTGGIWWRTLAAQAGANAVEVLTAYDDNALSPLLA